MTQCFIAKQICPHRCVATDKSQQHLGTRGAVSQRAVQFVLLLFSSKSISAATRYVTIPLGCLLVRFRFVVLSADSIRGRFVPVELVDRIARGERFRSQRLVLVVLLDVDRCPGRRFLEAVGHCEGKKVGELSSW